jgi:hypothetical protein
VFICRGFGWHGAHTSRCLRPVTGEGSATGPCAYARIGVNAVKKLWAGGRPQGSGSPPAPPEVRVLLPQSPG